ncbi:hypothetical protein LCGC14_1465690 [marine sediment metagenome]|uniref:Uncharacterized protein n=1 Tax=marine sediment metagenome TaxID=412755 RepID=A0A0F9JDU5_9ZZZZ
MARDRYEEGRRMGLLHVLGAVLRELGYDDPSAGQAVWILQREATVAALRQVCEDHGDNDWPDNLHLADVIEKHLHRHLGE